MCRHKRSILSLAVVALAALALCAPRPTLLATAQFDFFPIVGARESFAEARKLYQVAGAAERLGMYVRNEAIGEPAADRFGIQGAHK